MGYNDHRYEDPSYTNTLWYPKFGLITLWRTNADRILFSKLWIKLKKNHLCSYYDLLNLHFCIEVPQAIFLNCEFISFTLSLWSPKNDFKFMRLCEPVCKWQTSDSTRRWFTLARAGRTVFTQSAYTLACILIRLDKMLLLSNDIVKLV